MAIKSILVVILLCSCHLASCWDSNEMEVFDAYEEVNENFYQLMGLKEDAALPEIKRAYRTLSKQLHPDKNNAPDAEIKFRQLVSVYEVLKDPDKRRIYNRVLVEGPPDWRSAIYYYRRARKMSMMEIVLILTLVISVAQYLMAWGSYWDKWRTLEYHTSRKQKRKKRKPEDGGGESEASDNFEALIPKPSIYNILPIQVCIMSYRLVRYGPSLYREWRQELQEKERRIKEQKEKEEEEERLLAQEEEERKARKAAPKKRRKIVIPERKDIPREEEYCGSSSHHDPYEAAAAGLNTGLWSSEEFSELAKLMNKYPGGTTDRWEVIAQHLNRSTFEVTKMAQKVREKLASGSWLQEQEESIQSKIKVKTRSAGDGVSSTSSDAHWSSVQQKALEKALKSFPKGTDQRWERIAKQVPEKTSEDCINRFKFLAERIKKKKEEEMAVEEKTTDDKTDQQQGQVETDDTSKKDDNDSEASDDDEEEEEDSECDEDGATESD